MLEVLCRRLTTCSGSLRSKHLMKPLGRSGVRYPEVQSQLVTSCEGPEPTGLAEPLTMARPVVIGVLSVLKVLMFLEKHPA